ncbi:hypothetical protein B296_00003903 [Ensete ventricosum]|uniref:Uncharacterized protein n=1 Tax=Ensete ventricosum TaxID=4639 RepID=A0A427B3J3_ENSVE|nr:hypothetical protein B296_00003903 [Ensete ventricosum]
MPSSASARQAMRRLEAHEGKNTKGDSVPIHFATPLRKRNRVNERKGNLEGEVLAAESIGSGEEAGGAARRIGGR